MDKRIGWNLDSAEHATFNWIRPIPACSKVGSQVVPNPVAVPHTVGTMRASSLHKRRFKRRFILETGFALLILFWATALGPEPSAHISISPADLVRAVTTQRDSLIELCLMDHVDLNGRDAESRTPLLIAMSQQNWKTAQRLIDAGALVDVADANGFTPLMAAAKHGNLDLFQVLLGRLTAIHADAQCKDGSDLLSMALDGGNPQIVRSVVEHLPVLSEWRSSTRRALQGALAVSDTNQIRLLFSKHATPATPEGKSVPLLAYAVAGDDSSLFNMLVSCGADPNTVLPSRCDKDFLELLPSKSFSSYVEGDKGLTVLMLAAGLGRETYLRTLLAAGASRNQLTRRNKMSALDIAAETGHWRSSQILLGSGPPPDQLRVEISLALQRVALVRNGVPVYRTQCSTGRQGYTTRKGQFVITNKERNHRSSIYHVEMPYFMRLSCLDFGMHAGVVPNYPASHGCIRLPEEAARKFFSEIPIGTLVTVQ